MPVCSRLYHLVARKLDEIYFGVLQVLCFCMYISIYYIPREHIMFPWFLLITAMWLVFDHWCNACYALGRNVCLYHNLTPFIYKRHRSAIWNMQGTYYCLCICFGFVEKHMHMNGAVLSFPYFFWGASGSASYNCLWFIITNITSIKNS